MIKPWEICVLVYDYLQKSGYKETSSCFNKECPSLNLSDPPPNIFSCILEKLVSDGDLESRLKTFDAAQTSSQPEIKKLKDIESELQHIRKRLKKRKRHSSDHSCKTKQRKLVVEPENRSTLSLSLDPAPQSSSSLYGRDSNLKSSFFDDSIQPQNNFSGPAYVSSSAIGQPIHVSPEKENISSRKENTEKALCTPEKRLSSSRRKAATPKKLTSDLQGSIVQTLTDSINAKNEEAALDTLNSVEPWLEQFINSLSETPNEAELIPQDLTHQSTNNMPLGSANNKNEEAAMSLLALNQSTESESTTQPTQPIQTVSFSTTIQNIAPDQPSAAMLSRSNTAPVSNTMLNQKSETLAAIEARTVMTTSQASLATAAQSTAHDHLSSSFQQATTTTETHNMSFDPIVIRNQKTISIAQKNPNMEIIVLPSVQTQYQHILPKPRPAPDPVPSSFHVSGDTVAPIYNFVKPSPQQEAQKFFGQLHRPYHQHLSRIDQLYLVDRSVHNSKMDSPKTGAKIDQKVETDLEETTTAEAADQPQAEFDKCGDSEATTSGVKAKDSFVSWDQKIRKSIAETDFKTPPPPSGVKKKRRSKDKLKIAKASNLSIDEKNSQLEEGSQEHQNVKKHKKKKRKSKKDDGEKSSSKSKKKKKKKREKEKDSLKRPPITPEFVNESLSSGGEESVVSVPRVRHISESDSVMAETLLKSLKNTSTLPKSPQNCSTPVTSKVTAVSSLSTGQRLVETIKPSFIDETANSSFDIDEASRPKPVFIPEGSQNSCSCHSNHYKDSHKGKCSSSKTFSFKDDENVDSPKNYNEDSSITVASLFPTLTSPSISTSSKAEIKDKSSYRNQKPDEDSEYEQEDLDSDEEVREKTSKLPPISSQEKDLLDSSDEEPNTSENNEESSLLSAHKLSKSVVLSESDVDSPHKKSPIKGPKLKLVEKDNESSKRKKTATDESPNSSETAKNQGPTNESKEAEADLPSMLHAEDEIDDSQELIIDGDEPDKPVPSRPKSRRLSINKSRAAKLRARISRDGEQPQSSSGENNRNTENTGIATVIEDSCDTWYKNVENKVFKASYNCKICRKSFPSQAVLTVHAETCSRSYLVCTNCGRKCNSKSGLTLHKKTCLNPLTRPREGKKSSGENSKIKISSDGSKSGSQKKNKLKGGRYIEDIDEFLGKLRYQ